MAMEPLNITAECTEIYLKFDFQKPSESMDYLLSKLIEFFDAKSVMLYRVDKNSRSLVAIKFKDRDAKKADSQSVIEALDIPTSKEGVKYTIYLEDGTSLNEMQDIIDSLVNVFLKKLLGDYENSIPARYDVMTGTLNRNEFENVKKKIKKQDTLDYIVVSFIDVYSLKTINDTYGHDAGDRYIKKVASSITEYVNKALKGKASFFRSGGDEFVVLCKAGNEENAKSITSIVSAELDEAKKSVEEASNSIVGLPSVTSFDHGEAYGLSSQLSDVLVTADGIMFERKNKHKESKQVLLQP